MTPRRVNVPTVRLWHTVTVVATLLTQTHTGDGFSWKGLVIVLVIFAIVLPIQSRIRKAVSDRRRERWAQGDDPGQPTDPRDPRSR